MAKVFLVTVFGVVLLAALLAVGKPQLLQKSPFISSDHSAVGISSSTDAFSGLVSDFVATTSPSETQAKSSTQSQKSATQQAAFAPMPVSCTSSRVIAPTVAYERWLDDTRSLYFSLAIPTSEAYALYLHDRAVRGDDCLTFVGEVPAAGPGGALEYDVELYSENVIRVRYSDGDLGGSVREVFYIDVARPRIMLSYRISQERTVYFILQGNTYSFSPLIDVQPTAGCDFAGPEYETVTIEAKDILENGHPLSVLATPIAFSGRPELVCGSFALADVRVHKELETAELKWQNIPNLSVFLSRGDGEADEINARIRN